jgi:hypothetical protein
MAGKSKTTSPVIFSHHKGMTPRQKFDLAMQSMKKDESGYLSLSDIVLENPLSEEETVELAELIDTMSNDLGMVFAPPEGEHGE